MIPLQTIREMAATAAETVGPALSRLKWLFAKGYDREAWSFDNVLATAAGKIPEDEMPFYRALADAILDEQKVADLDQFERWREIEPTPIGEPWDIVG